MMNKGTGFVPIPTTKTGTPETKAELESGENPPPSHDVNHTLDTNDSDFQDKTDDDLPSNQQVLLDSQGETPSERVRCYELDKQVRSRRSDSVDSSRTILHPSNDLDEKVAELDVEDADDDVSTFDVEPRRKEGVIQNWKFLEVLFFLLGRSSVLAVSRLGKAQTKRKRAFWLLVLTASLFGCCYQVRDFLTVYFQYPVLTDVVMTRETPNPSFPAVTICNLNRMKYEWYDCVKQGKSWSECNDFGPLPLEHRDRIVY